MTEPDHTFTQQQQAAAASWMASRDRGLSASEQDAYIDWLAEDPAHARAIQHFERVWQFCDRLEQWRPAHGSQPNPDLLAPRRRRPRLSLVVAAMAAAAAMALVWMLPLRDAGLDSAPLAGEGPVPAGRQASHVLTAGINSRQLLEDGSVIEMSSNAIIELAYSAAERRVRLIRGEACFTVAHDASRPFVVEVGGVTVQALGTVFSVELDQFEVAVEVSEGSVEVREAPQSAAAGPGTGIVLAAGEKAVLRYARLIPFDQHTGPGARPDPKD